jgi:hypothetical protein
MKRNIIHELFVVILNTSVSVLMIVENESLLQLKLPATNRLEMFSLDCGLEDGYFPNEFHSRSCIRHCP